uniref:Variable lymphocyte receptor A cassette n=1 Tax=Petromyzon marinus TaxID=7757 RepID=S4S1L7_PETMA
WIQKNADKVKAGSGNDLFPDPDSVTC